MEFPLTLLDSLMIVLIVMTSINFLPAVVWDMKTGRYSGYFGWKALSILLFIAVFSGFDSVQQGSEGPVIMTDISFHLFQVLVFSRLFVEFSHHHKYKVWLHRKYHKLTDHEDPREASP